MAWNGEIPISGVRCPKCGYTWADIAVERTEEENGEIVRVEVEYVCRDCGKHFTRLIYKA